MCRLTTSLSTDCKSCTLLTSVHNDAEAADATDDADDYNRVIGIALLKAFSCVKMGTNHRNAEETEEITAVSLSKDVSSSDV